ncbi:hypothetical protein PHLGIDRAFT_117498 [Phlebiopsis gigantea 11061_1 CR5-6]|uniref:TOG domain-containing protein n=1 Tax=Phlebiopsis gigantea (strain 11061_1 CR5-6) TaxID=745531 RepID=A0A0C3S9C7_PHLG1|nr:hypothetical protein PHLGIDRAFT_117498 [Phlebiopsis gigantea 11061_1 CR5-6]
MLTEHSVSSSSSSTSSSSPAASLDPDISPPASPSLELTPTLQRGARLHPDNTISDPKRSDAPSYSPHAVGLGLAAPRPHRVPLAPFSADMVGQPQEQSVSTVSLPHRPSETSSNDPASIYVQPPPQPRAESSTAILTFAAQSVGSIEQRPPSPGMSTGLHIAIPSPHHPGNPFVHSRTTPSPPPAGHPSTAQHAEGLTSPLQTSPGALELGQELTLPPPPNPIDGALDLDFTEFESEGLSALEKIYLFSRSPAGFQRVFIAHALPGYLRHRRAADQAQAPAGELVLNEDNDEADHITPAEAVEYVLPLLNLLALDEDEVKEALAEELVPIIWWFITRCRFVDDDDSGEQLYPEPPDEPTRISIQSFMPILGPLLLSTNNHVGGPARLAVVELLKRVRRADARDRRESEEREGGASQAGTGGSEQHHTAAPAGASTATPGQDEEEAESYSPTGLLGHAERRLFEREMVQQVVIGMGRLDLLDENVEWIPDVEMADGEEDSGVPTPVVSAHHWGEDSYFPAVGFVQVLSETTVSPVSSSSNMRLEALPSPSAVLSTTPSDVSSTYSPFSTEQHSLSSSGIDSSPALSPITPPDMTSIYGAAETHRSSPPLSPCSTPLDLHTHAEWSQVTSSRPHSLSSVHTFRLPSPRPSSPRPSSPSISNEAASDASFQSHALEHASVPVIDQRGPFSPDIAMPTPNLPQGTLHPGLRDPSNAELSTVQPEGQESETTEEAQASEEASVGRFSSMSLMAAVTASGSIDDEMKAAFVAEVERVGRDPVFWVRKEASFTVGALAKVVSQEVVLISLLPLFETLYRDASWQVRHSALFALPAILSRLPPHHRRSLALDVVTTLARDESQYVRQGVLEALAEIIYTFHEDADKPPDQLLRLFLGVREQDDVRRLEKAEEPPPPSPPSTPMSWSEFVSSMSSGMHEAAQERDIYEDPLRPLVCAFNYPAVALTLGRERWHEIRELYLSLSENPMVKVRRTLAASLGEIARIIGPEQAKQDLVRVWWTSMHAEESEVRLKAVETLTSFIPALGDAERSDILKGLNGDVWARLRMWREREAVMKALGGWAAIISLDETVLRGLLRKGLQDTVASVREESVTALAALAVAWSTRPQSLEHLWEMLRTLATSSSYRHRMTSLSCYQTVLLALKDFSLLSESFLQTLKSLGKDSTVDVRIRTSRFLGILVAEFPGLPDSVYQAVRELAQDLSADSSHDVKAFAQSLLSNSLPPQNSRNREAVEAAKQSSVFSRPPPS